MLGKSPTIATQKNLKGVCLPFRCKEEQPCPGLGGIGRGTGGFLPADGQAEGGRPLLTREETK